MKGTSLLFFRKAKWIANDLLQLIIILTIQKHTADSISKLCTCPRRSNTPQDPIVVQT